MARSIQSAELLPASSILSATAVRHNKWGGDNNKITIKKNSNSLCGYKQLKLLYKTSIKSGLDFTIYRELNIFTPTARDLHDSLYILV